METNIADKLLRTNNDFATPRAPVDVQGMSSPRVCAFLNLLVRNMDDGEKYLEVGSWKGRTLLSAAIDNKNHTCIGCDKFRFFGRFTGFGALARRSLRKNLARYEDRCNIEFHDTTSRRLFAESRVTGPIGVYFYDGDHSYEGTHHGMVAAAPLLSERAIVLVDDWNDPIIRRATHAGLRDAKLLKLWHRSLDGDHSERSWWNGLGVFFVAHDPMAMATRRAS